MQSIRLLMGAVSALVAMEAFSPETAIAQPFVAAPPGMRASHVGIQPYMRIPVGSRAEAAALKADQDAAKLAIQPKKKGRKGH
jgi:hypothetical protein